MRRRRSNVVVRAIGGGVALVAAAFTGIPSSSAASTFTTSAGAELMRLGFRLEPGIIVEQLLDPGVAAAQARLDSLGSSTAFASDPYPGEFAVQLPALLDGLGGGATNLPEYPLYATSTFPAAPDALVTAGPVVLEARSRRTESAGSVVDGADRASATTAVDDIDAVTASATAEVGAFDLGGAVRVAGARSVAQVVQVPGQDLERTTEFSVTRIELLGQAFRIGEDGFELLGQAVPLGRGTAAVLAPLLEQLATSGIRVTVIDPVETEEGVVSGGLQLEYPAQIPDYGTGTVTVTLGRTYAAVGNRARPAVTPAEGVGTPPTGLVPAGPRAPTGTVVGSTTPAVGGAVPSPAGGTATAVSPPAVSPAADAASYDTADRISTSRFYPVLVLAGVVLVLFSSAFRQFGVRLSWTS